jgi:hypothetical protein
LWEGGGMEFTQLKQETPGAVPGVCGFER